MTKKTQAAEKAEAEKAEAEKAEAEKAEAEKAEAEKAEAEKAEAEKAEAEKAAAEKAASAKIGKVPALSVKSKREGFRRAGRAWSKEAVTVPVSELTEVQIAQLKDEPELTVSEVEIAAPAQAE